MFGTGVSSCVYLASGPSREVTLPIEPAPLRRSAKTSLVLTTAMAAAISGLAAGSAHAQVAGACGPLAADGSVTCTPQAGAYPGGIAYATPPADPADPDSGILDLSVALRDGVVVALPADATAAAGIDLTGLNGGAVALSRLDIAEVGTAGDEQIGVRAMTEAGAIRIDAPGLRTAGDDSTGLFARTSAGGAIDIKAADITTSGSAARGIDARALAGGDLTIVAPGAIGTAGIDSTGIFGSTAAGHAYIEAGSISTTGDYSDAIVARGTDVDVVVSGAVKTAGYNSYGAYLKATGDATIRVDGSISTSGLRSNGIGMHAGGSGAITGAGSITTTGDSAPAVSLFTGSGDAVIDLAHVRTSGEGADAVFVSADGGNASVTIGDAETDGERSRTIAAFSTTGDVLVTGTGSIASNGSYGTGIQALADEGTANVRVQNVSATGDNSSAIYAGGRGVQITIDGTASTRGSSSFGDATVDARGTSDYYTGVGGNVLVTNNGRVESQGDSVGALYARGDGDVSIAGAGTFATAGYNAKGLNLRSGGALSVDIGDVTTLGALSTGISAQSHGSIDLHVGSISTSGDGAGGIVAAITAPAADDDTDRVAVTASPATGDVVINAGSVTTSGDDATAISALALGNASVTAGTVRTSGDRSSGIRAVAIYGDSTVTAVDVSTQGSSLYGVGARSYFGNAEVTTTGSVSTIGDKAIGVGAQAVLVGDATVSVNDVSTHGVASTGVAAIGFNAGATVNGTVSTSGRNALGVYANAIDTAAVANNGKVETTGDFSSGIVALGGGNVTVSGAGSVSTAGAYSNGISARSTYGAVTVNAGDVVTKGGDSLGIRAEALGHYTYDGGEGDSGEEEGGEGEAARVAVTAVSPAPAAQYTDVVVNAGSVTTSGAYSGGIFARADQGGATVTSTGTISTAGYYAHGIVATGSGYDATVNVNNVTTTGVGAKGVVASALYDASVTVSGHVSTSGGAGSYGNGAIGVMATSSDGNAQVVIEKGASVTTAGDHATAIAAKGYYGATVVNDGTISTSGTGADGINATSEYGDVKVTNAGAITTSGESSRGIFAGSYFNVAIDGSGTVGTSGNYAAGIAASAGETATIAAGTVTTAGQTSAGISAYGQLGATITAGTVATKGDNSPGIIAGSYGDARVTATAVTTEGAYSDGIRAASFGAGSRVVVKAADIVTNGDGSHAIWANAFAGDAFAVTSGTVVTTGANADAITVSGGGGQAVAVVNNVLTYGAGSSAVVLDAAGSAYAYVGGLVKGAADGIRITSGTDATLVNVGAITAGTGNAIDIKGGPATVLNYAIVSGGVSLTGGDDLFDNENAFFAGNSDFGAGQDRLINAGQIVIDGHGDGLPATVTFANLETFDNKGWINLANGTAGDMLAVPGARFTGSGNSLLSLDIAYGATMVTDRLTLGSASGSTIVDLLPLGGEATFTPGATIVQASAASSPTAFTLAANARDVGFVHYAIVYRPETFAYQLVGTPSAAAYRTAGYAEGAQQLWYKSADAITAHLTGLRDAGWIAGPDAKGALWLQMFGDVARRNEQRSYAVDGVTLANIDFSTRQDVFGGQLGYDFGSGSAEGRGTLFGLTGGYQNSTLRYVGSADRAVFDDLNIGIYGSWHGGKAFINGLAKYDRYWGRVRGLEVGYRDKLDGGSYGAQIEAGIRLGSDGFFAEPVASIAYTRTDLDSFAVLGTSVGYPEFNGLRAKGGLRIGGTSNMKGGGRITFYASAEAVHEFEGQPTVKLVNAGGAYRFEGDRIGTYAKGTIGANITGVSSKVSGYMEGFGTTGSGYEGGGGRVGIRIKF